MKPFQTTARKLGLLYLFLYHAEEASTHHYLSIMRLSGTWALPAYLTLPPPTRLYKDVTTFVLKCPPFDLAHYLCICAGRDLLHNVSDC
jgi:hypothetical protein